MLEVDSWKRLRLAGRLELDADHPAGVAVNGGSNGAGRSSVNVSSTPAGAWAGECESVEAAYEQGRAAIRLAGHADDRPRLAVRAGVHAGRLVLAADRRSPARYLTPWARDIDYEVALVSSTKFPIEGPFRPRLNPLGPCE
jgi:hypothetical protein